MNSKYISLISKTEEKRRKKWQGLISKTLKKIKGGEKIKILGLEFYLCRGVFAPLWTDSVILAKTIEREVKEEDFVLDVGTGIGIQAIFAAKKKAKVIATDINSKALKCTNQNIKYHKLENRIEVLKSDLFSSIKNKFDLIIFNPPFRWFQPKNILERSVSDKNYQVLTNFFSEAKNYLNKKGRIILVWSTSADPKYLQCLIKEYKYNSKILKKARTKYDNKYTWEYRVYELKP